MRFASQCTMPPHTLDTQMLRSAATTLARLLFGVPCRIDILIAHWLSAPVRSGGDVHNFDSLEAMWWRMLRIPMHLSIHCTRDRALWRWSQTTLFFWSDNHTMDVPWVILTPIERKIVWLLMANRAIAFRSFVIDVHGDAQYEGFFADDVWGANCDTEAFVWRPMINTFGAIMAEPMDGQLFIDMKTILARVLRRSAARLGETPEPGTCDTRMLCAKMTAVAAAVEQPLFAVLCAHYTKMQEELRQMGVIEHATPARHTPGRPVAIDAARDSFSRSLVEDVLSRIDV